MSQPIIRTRSSSSVIRKSASHINLSSREASSPFLPHDSQLDVPLEILDFLPVPKPCSSKVTYYYSKKSFDHIAYIYRVVDKGGPGYLCMPEAQGWPEIIWSAEQVDLHMQKLEEGMIFSNDPHLQESGGVMFPSLTDLKKWPLGCAVCFRHYDVCRTANVVGRFVWTASVPSSKEKEPTNNCKTLSIVLLLQTCTNNMLLSTEVTDLVVESATAKAEGYIQGISLLAIVATLIANVTYTAMVTPPKRNNKDRAGGIPATFSFFNAIAFYCSVLAVVLMTAFIPIFGTARQWGAIFLSGSMPVVMGLVSFYIAFMVSAWSVMDMWEKPLTITLLGLGMVAYVYIWAVQLMNGHIEKDLRVQPRMTAWDWYVKRTGITSPPFMLQCVKRIKFMWHTLPHSNQPFPSLTSAIVTSRTLQHKDFLQDL